MLPLPFTNFTGLTSPFSATSDLQRKSVQDSDLTQVCDSLHPVPHPKYLGHPAYCLQLGDYYHASFLRTPVSQDLHLVTICTHRPTDMETIPGSCLLPPAL